MEKNGILVLLVIVLVSKVLLVFGWLIISMFFGMLLLRCWNLFGFCRKLINFFMFFLVLFILVIFVKVVLIWFLFIRCVLFLLNDMGFLLLLLFCICCMKNMNSVIMIRIGKVVINSCVYRFWCLGFLLMILILLVSRLFINLLLEIWGWIVWNWELLLWVFCIFRLLIVILLIWFCWIILINCE